MSIYRSLKSLYRGPVIHSHSFSPQDKDYAVRRLYAWHQAGKPVRVISLVREPISRNVSSFFENFERYTGVAPKQSAFSVEELKELFLEKFDANGAAKWYEEFLVKGLGVEPLGAPVQAPGVQQITHQNVRLLFCKTELTDSEKELAVKDFLGLQKFLLAKENVGAKKDYAFIYQEFKQHVRFSPEYVEPLLNDAYCQHFYSNEERDEMRAKWMEH